MNAGKAFTLIELLVVVAILAALFGMISTSLYKRDERRAAVVGAAHELAATLRQARALAMERNASVGVSFNVENAPGSSGWTINNHAGGHWYRVIGPAGPRQTITNADDSSLPMAQFNTYPIALVQKSKRRFAEAVAAAWYGDRHVLAKGKVRFLAVADQDNGPRSLAYGPGVAQYRASGTPANFYPRPWFGRWDASTNRLYPWGGYHPDLRSADAYVAVNATTFARQNVNDRQPVSYTGFYYEGSDARNIQGCVNPSTRLVWDDTNGDFQIDAAGGADQRTYPLWQQGEGRPLINGEWLDAVIVFHPDGTAVWRWFDLRRKDSDSYAGGNAYFNEPSHNLQEIGPGDRTHMCDSTYGHKNPFFIPEAQHWSSHTGAYTITLAGDAPRDDAQQDLGHFSDVKQALDSMRPVFRVAVSRTGEVRLYEVGNGLPADFPGWDPTFTTAGGADPWADDDLVKTRYRFGSLCDANWKPVGFPVIDALTPEMLSESRWWMNAP